MSSKKALPTVLTNQRISLPVNLIRAYTWDKSKYVARQLTPKGGVVAKDVNRIVRRKIFGIVKSKDGMRGYFIRKGKLFSALYNETDSTWMTDRLYNAKDKATVLKQLA